MSAPELLQWHDAAITKPDSDMTVLAWTDEGFCTAWRSAAARSSTRALCCRRSP